ncbi:hypothetical protein JCM11491_000006 [Sporobolomyces phaffii]
MAHVSSISLGKVDEGDESFVWIRMGDSELEIDVRIPSETIKLYNEKYSVTFTASGSKKDTFRFAKWKFVLACPPEPPNPKRPNRPNGPPPESSPHVCLEVQEIEPYGIANDAIILAKRNTQLKPFRRDTRVLQTLSDVEHPDGGQNASRDPEVVCEGDLPSFAPKQTKAAHPVQANGRERLGFTRAPAGRASTSTSSGSHAGFDWQAAKWPPGDVDYSTASRSDGELARVWNDQKVKTIEARERRGKKVDAGIKESVFAEREALKRPATANEKDNGIGKGKELKKGREHQVATSSSTSKPRQLPTPTSLVVAPVEPVAAGSTSDLVGDVSKTSNPVAQSRRGGGSTRSSTSPSQRLSQSQSQSSSGRKKKMDKVNTAPPSAKGKEKAIDEDQMDIDEEFGEIQGHTEEGEHGTVVIAPELGVDEQIQWEDTPTPETLAQARAMDQARLSAQESFPAFKGVRVTYSPGASELGISEDEAEREQELETAAAADEGLLYSSDAEQRVNATNSGHPQRRPQPRSNLANDVFPNSRRRLKEKPPPRHTRYSLDETDDDDHQATIDADHYMMIDDSESEDEVEKTLLSQKQVSQNQAKKAAASSSPAAPTRTSTSRPHALTDRASDSTSALQLLVEDQFRAELEHRRSRLSSKSTPTDAAKRPSPRGQGPMLSLAPTQASATTAALASHSSTFPLPAAAQAAPSATPFTASMINHALGGGDIGDSTMESISFSGLEAGFPRGGQTVLAAARNHGDEAGESSKEKTQEKGRMTSGSRLSKRKREDGERETSERQEGARAVEKVRAALRPPPRSERREAGIISSRNWHLGKEDPRSGAGASANAAGTSAVKESKTTLERARSALRQEEVGSSRSEAEVTSKEPASTTAVTRGRLSEKPPNSPGNPSKPARTRSKEDLGAPKSASSKKRSGARAEPTVDSSMTQTSQSKKVRHEVAPSASASFPAVRPLSAVAAAPAHAPPREEEWLSLVASFASRRLPSPVGETPIEKMRRLRERRKRCETALEALRV